MTGVHSIPKRLTYTRVQAVITIVACVTMSACAHMPWSSRPHDNGAGLKPQPQATLTPLPPPAKLPTEKPPRTARVAPPATTPQSKADAAPAPAAQIIGLSQDDIRKTWGEPRERIAHGAGEAWVYKNPRCTLEIVFFLDVTRNGYYALDRKVSGTDGTDTAARACLTEIQNARQ